MTPEEVWCDIFDGFFRGNFRPEAISNVISGMVNQDVGMDGCMCQFWWFYVEAVGGVIFGRFSNVNNFRTEVGSDVISGEVVVDPTGLKVRVKFGVSWSDRSRDIRLPHFVTNNDNDGRRTLWQ